MFTEGKYDNVGITMLRTISNITVEEKQYLRLVFVCIYTLFFWRSIGKEVGSWSFEDVKREVMTSRKVIYWLVSFPSQNKIW